MVGVVGVVVPLVIVAVAVAMIVHCDTWQVQVEMDMNAPALGGIHFQRAQLLRRVRVAGARHHPRMLVRVLVEQQDPRGVDERRRADKERRSVHEHVESERGCQRLVRGGAGGGAGG